MNSYKCVLLCLIVPGSLLGQAKWGTTVQLKVNGPEEFKVPATSYFSRELRSLGDITLVDVNPVFVLNVFAIDNKTKGGGKIGFTMNVELLRSVSTELIQFVVAGISKETTDEQKQSTRKLIDSSLA